MNYVALYRKYRPETFDDVKGQNVIVQTLRNQIVSGRIAHAYLFYGPRGTGKTSIAKIFAKAINCSSKQNGNPCLSCTSCTMTDDMINPDIIEIDAASNNGVDNIRSLIEDSKYLPQNGEYKVYIIDEVHMLSTNAFNALLKTLEEPPAKVVFILATTEEHKVPVTIKSRCQRHNFKLITDEQIIYTLQEKLDLEGITYEDEALKYISKTAQGGLRDAFSLTDQCIAVTNHLSLQAVMDVFGDILDDIVTKVAKEIENGDISNLLSSIDLIISEGKSLGYLSLRLYEYFKKKLLNDNSQVYLLRYMRILAELSEKMRYNNNRTVFEIEVMKMCKIQEENQLYEKITELEKEINSIKTGIPIVTLSSPIDEEVISFKYQERPFSKLHVYYL